MYKEIRSKTNQNIFQLIDGRYWYNICAPHLCKEASKDEVSEMLRGGGLFLTNTYDFDCQNETSFWWVIKDTFGGMEELSSKMRNQVKKSLKTYDVEKVTKEEILRIGLEIGNRALEGYKIKEKLHYSQQELEDYINSRSDREYWAVYTKEEHIPVAYAVNTIENGVCVGYNRMKCDPAYQHNSTYPYYGLIYEMNRYYLLEKGMLYVNDGRRSLSEHSNIQPFLIEKFHFRKAYCRLQIEYRWYFGVLVRLSCTFKRFISNHSLKMIIKQELAQRGEL